MKKTLAAVCGGIAFAVVSSLSSRAYGGNDKLIRSQGEALFNEKGCSHCHGPDGFGGSDSGPDLSGVRKRLEPEQITHQIHDGGKNMPPFGDSLSADQIASLVAYLHGKRKAPKSAQRRSLSIPAAAPSKARTPRDPD